MCIVHHQTKVKSTPDTLESVQTCNEWHHAYNKVFRRISPGKDIILSSLCNSINSGGCLLDRETQREKQC